MNSRQLPIVLQFVLQTSKRFDYGLAFVSKGMIVTGSDRAMHIVNGTCNNLRPAIYSREMGE